MWLGSGWIPGYAVVNLRGTYRLASDFEVFARVSNLFNRSYATAGILTTNTFNPNGTFRFSPDT